MFEEILSASLSVENLNFIVLKLFAVKRSIMVFDLTLL